MAPGETCLWGVLLVNAAAYICQTSVKILQKMSIFTGPGKSFRTELGLEKILKFDVKGPWRSRSFDHSNYVYIFQTLWTGQCTIVYKIPKILLKQLLLCNCSMLNKFSALILLVGWQEGYAVCKKTWSSCPQLCGGFVKEDRSHTHTHPFNGPFPALPRWAGTRKVKPIWILLKQESVSGSGISWAICKSAPHSRQITTPAPHHSVFYRPDALLATQPTASKHWRHKKRR